jgi:hypothetical protein
MVVRVARRYHQLKLGFCIITFYDPQRAAITRALENEDLPSDCVYSVDSFQGMWRSPCISVDSLRLTSPIPNRRSTQLDLRERSRLRDIVFRPDKAAGILEIAAPHERRSDPLPQGNGSCHRQELLTGRGREHAPRAALPHLVQTPPRLLDRFESHAKQLRSAPWTTGTGTSTSTSTAERHARPQFKPQRAHHNATTPQPAVSDSDPDPDSDSDSGSDLDTPRPSIPVGTTHSSSGSVQS